MRTTLDVHNIPGQSFLRLNLQYGKSTAGFFYLMLSAVHELQKNRFLSGDKTSSEKTFSPHLLESKTSLYTIKTKMSIKLSDKYKSALLTKQLKSRKIRPSNHRIRDFS